jgi:hypothetical protein
MNFNNLLVAGCSFANGSGLPNENKNPKIWANQLAQKLNIIDVNNVAQTGANNYWIFLETMSRLIKKDYDLVIVEWSAIPRYKFHVGLELYTVHSLLNKDINLVGHETISAKKLGNIKNFLLKIHNDHWDILDLVKYANVLIEVQVRTRQKHIFFVNGLGPWSDQYFIKKQITKPSDLDRYTYNLLQVDQRDDQEIFDLYNMIHSHYESYGGIQESYWLNLYQSMFDTAIDSVSETDRHPGYQSQDFFTDIFYRSIQDKLNETSNNSNTR